MKIYPPVSCNSCNVLVAASGKAADDDVVPAHGRSYLHQMCDCVGAFNGADDTLGAGDVLKCVYRFVVGDGNVFRPAYLVKVSVLRTDTGVVKTCGD